MSTKPSYAPTHTPTHRCKRKPALTTTQLSEDRRVVVLRFGRASDAEVMEMDEYLFKIADKVKNFASIYLVDNKEVPDFNAMYELYDPCTVMFFWR